jgi:hypothetical protein
MQKNLFARIDLCIGPIRPWPNATSAMDHQTRTAEKSNRIRTILQDRRARERKRLPGRAVNSDEVAGIVLDWIEEHIDE